MKKFSYYLGDIEISGNNINSLREFVENLRENSIGFPNSIEDFLFSIELDYQKYHDLRKDDYEYHKELK